MSGNIEKREKLKPIAGVILSALLITVAGFIILLALGHYRDETLADFDASLWETGQAIDYNINNSLERFDGDLEYTVTRQEFIYAEDLWARTGDTSDMLAQMKSGSLANRQMFQTMLAIGIKGVFLSTDGSNDYLVEDRIEDNIYRCTDPEGKMCLAFIYKVDENLSYAGIMSIEALFDYVKNKIAGDSNSIRLADLTGDIVLESRGIDKKGMREITMPAANTENRLFTITVAADSGKMISLMKATTAWLVTGMFIAAAGVLLIVAFAEKYRRRATIAGRELRKLKAKNKAMEELTRRTQELAHHQRLETIGTLTSSIAHEFNNLLTPIMGYSMMTLEKLPQDMGIYDDVLEIYNASCKAKDIISRLSELSRKNTETVFEELSPDELVNKVLKVSAPALSKNVDISRDLHCPGKTVFGNEVQLSQLLLNLILNAFQAMHDEGGNIYVSTYRESGENLIVIRDEGEGIPASVMKNIFEPFFTTKETGKGTGLGLAIAAQAAEDHNGSIDVESEEGVGTKFTVHIPEILPEEKEKNLNEN